MFGKRTPGSTVTAAALIAINIGAGLVAISANAQEAAQPPGLPRAKAMWDLGARIQGGKACGIPDDKMSGAYKEHDTTLALSAAIQHSKVLSAKDKQVIGTTGELEAAFSDGGRRVEQLPAPSDKDCEQTKAGWSTLESASLEFAKKEQRRLALVAKLG